MKKKYLTSSVFLILILILVWFFFFKEKIITQKIIFPELNSGNNTIDQQLLFEDLTIPYLRKKTYQSSLGELVLLNSNQNYESFLTSYTSDGLKINALLTKPKKDPPLGGWPAIIFVHGFIPPTLYKTEEKYVAYVDYLAKNGFVIFKIDLRGHGASEGIPGGAYYSSDYVIDTLNAYVALESSDFVNPKKIGLWGHSMAGNIVLRSAVSSPQIPAISIWSGAGFSYEDLQKYRLNDASYRPPASNTNQHRRRTELFAKQGQFSLDSDFWKQVAPTNYLPDLKGAVELHHAINDNVVSIEYSRDLNINLNKTSVPHSLFEYTTGGHNIEDPSFTKAMQRTVEFFQKYLK